MFSINKVKTITSSLRSYPVVTSKAHDSCFSSNKSALSPTQAQVIICGAGAVANSVAYHLIENGWTDILLIDKGRLVIQAILSNLRKYMKLFHHFL